MICDTRPCAITQQPCAITQQPCALLIIDPELDVQINYEDMIEIHMKIFFNELSEMKQIQDSYLHFDITKTKL